MLVGFGSSICKSKCGGTVVVLVGLYRGSVSIGKLAVVPLVTILYYTNGSGSISTCSIGIEVATL